MKKKELCKQVWETVSNSEIKVYVFLAVDSDKWIYLVIFLIRPLNDKYSAGK